MKMKEPDCVAMKRRGAKKIYEQTKDMSLQQRLEFWDERTRELRSRQEELRNKRTQQE